jgi:predicted DsbA family dithiol-disulfide isomerase
MTTERTRPRTPKTIAAPAGRRGVLAAAALAAGAVFVLDLGAQETTKPAVPEVVARIGDTVVDRESVMREASASLQAVESERLKCEQDANRNEHAALEQAAERVVHRKLFALEAQRRGVTEEALRDELKTKNGEVTDAEVDAFFEANSARIQQPKEQVFEQIRAYLKQQKLQQADADFFAEAEKNFKVDYLMEPHRVEVAATGSARGPATAPVTIVEFSDFECPFCKRVLATLDQIEEKYGDKVRVVYRHYPLSSHANAQKAAEASLCAADQGKFWEMHDLLFNEQQKLAVADLKEKATRLGLDGAKFDECLDSNRHAEAVQADARAGDAAGVSGTPAFFVNGRFLSGAVPFENFAELIDDEVKRSERD